MVSSKKFLLIASILVLFASQLIVVEANPIVGVCVKNCLQCKNMFGVYFEGQLCADSCVKFQGKVAPDCDDIKTLWPFLNKSQ